MVVLCSIILKHKLREIVVNAARKKASILKWGKMSDNFQEEKEWQMWRGTVWPDWANLKRTTNKFSYKSNPNMWWFIGPLETYSNSIICGIFSATIVTNWATFYSNIWSHWMIFSRSEGKCCCWCTYNKWTKYVSHHLVYWMIGETYSRQTALRVRS